MTDTLSKEERSRVMSRIRSRDTGPEMIVRRFLFSRGLRFRVNVKKIVGHPDIVLAKYGVIIEVRGCFWHRHRRCKIATTPKSNVEFWREKFRRNVKRDRQHEKEWRNMGWRLCVVWECELAPSRRAETLARLYGEITGRGLEYGDGGTEVALAAEESASYDV